ncbi:uncharacterized protein LAESUDRAFT_124757 [Laetiporus sulphureus 93-53]|uniref:Uncharacterized protein n=1 Tax=Laetiporus sulphureus 93-53 TaxID=1314785 RepID=A0A165EM02_9APHY|nr:uncharacterized protein LAESUDRAFT_124757 [Laetiporus sulphureus 93-53]KZT07337.1 hypothetical protein LAESUDRAFT_124757 [Laetiporus sulphureus 93-53]
MSTKTPVLAIADPEGSLSTCTPYLMPFHIAYSGPAPVSTYFRVKPASTPTHGKQASAEVPKTQEDESSQAVTLAANSSSSSQSTLVASSSSASLDVTLPAARSQDTIVAGDQAMTDVDAEVEEPKRFIAAFRGRTVQGLQVTLPVGYGGLVLRTPDEKPKNDSPQGRTGEKKRKGGMRLTRHSARAVIDDDAEETLDDPDTPVRRLQPTATFSSFVLWNQDIPVDDGRDEYLRSLTEWTRLAAEIHRCEEDS